MTQPLLTTSELAPQHQIRQFQQFRWGLILTEYAASALAFSLSFPITSWPLLLLLLSMHGCSNLALPIWPGSQRYPERVFMIGILLDLLILTMLLVLSGGASNGLIALLLLPVAVCAVLLPTLLAYLTAFLAVACYALLLQLGNIQSTIDHRMDHSMHQHMNHAITPVETGFSQHMLQMGWAFALSALLIAWFISAQAKLIRQKSQQLNDLQQQQSRQEQMLAVATYAANAAHDLATPLQNITFLSDELMTDTQAHHQPFPPELLQDLQAEVGKCQHIVQQLRRSAQQLRSQKTPAQPVMDISTKAIQLWLVSRPDISLQLTQHQDESRCELQDALAWSAALFNILDNAADASLENAQPKLDIELQLHQGQFQMQLRDFGAGLTSQQLAELGRQPQPDSQGLGLGQFLANTSIERLGGQVSRFKLPQGGTLTDIRFKAT